MTFQTSIKSLPFQLGNLGAVVGLDGGVSLRVLMIGPCQQIKMVQKPSMLFRKHNVNNYEYNQAWSSRKTRIT
jgi:hypothetical protein